MSKEKKKKKKHEQDIYPIEVCKFFQKDGTCTELVDRICFFKKYDWLSVNSAKVVCTKFKPEQDGED